MWDLTGDELKSRLDPSNFTQFQGNLAVQAEGLRGDWTKDATSELNTAPEIKPQGLEF